MPSLHLFPCLTRRVAALDLAVLSASVAFAQVPTFTVVNTSLDATFGNVGNGIFDPRVQGLTSVAFGANLFVAIGNTTGEDVIRWATSPDGVMWTARSQTLSGGLKSYTQTTVHFLNGKFMSFAVHTAPNVSSTWGYTRGDGLTRNAAKVSDGNHRFEKFDSSTTLTVAAGSDGDQ